MNTQTDIKFLVPEQTPQLDRGPSWLKEQRRNLGDSFNDAELPRRGLHLWRYTDPTRFLVEQEARDIQDRKMEPLPVEATLLKSVHNGELAGLVIDRGGQSVEVTFSVKLKAQGVTLSSLAEAADSHPDAVRKYLYGLVNAASGKFEALNGALWNDGVFLMVPEGITVEQPIHLLRQAGPTGAATFPRLLVIAGKNSEVAIVDEYAGGGTEHGEQRTYSNGAVEIFADDDSRVRYVILQRYGAGTDAYLTHRSQLGRNATMLTVPLSFGGLLAKSNFGSILNAEGAESNISGLIFGSGRQHFDNHTLHHHTSSLTHSDIDYKVVLKDRAESAYTGLIRIENDAKTCEAYQENRNLLLNAGAKAETIPELEILNEDVQCSHGATVGPIDPMAIFYLSSRGIERDEAVRMIIGGYVDTTLSRLPGDLQDRVRSYVVERLEEI